MKRTGCIKREARKSRGDRWVYRHYITRPKDGKRVEHTAVIGSVSAFPKIEDAWAEVTRRKLDRPQLLGTNSEVTFEALADQYKVASLKKLAHSSQLTNQHIIDNYLVPRWGKDLALEIKALAIEQWLESLPLANATRSRIVKVMSVIYKRAQKYDLVPQAINPCLIVDQPVASDYEAIILTPNQSTDIIAGLPLDVQTLVIVIASTGLRISEALGLHWSDIEAANQRIHIRRAWVKQQIGETKPRLPGLPFPALRC